MTPSASSSASVNANPLVFLVVGEVFEYTISTQASPIPFATNQIVIEADKSNEYATVEEGFAFATVFANAIKFLLSNILYSPPLSMRFFES